MFGGQGVVQQLRLGQRRRQGGGGAPAFLLRVFVQFGPDPARAGHFLQDQRAGAPTGWRLGAGEMDLAAQLLAGFKIMQRHRGERAAVDRDDTLMPIVAALIDGEREIAGAEQRIGCGGGLFFEQCRQHIRVRTRVAAQRPGVGAIGQQHVHRAIALGLQTEGAAEFQRRGQPGRQSQCLAHQLRDHGVVAMPGQQRVGQAAEADKPPPHRAVREEERHHATRDDDVGHGWAPDIEENGRVGHATG